jgi:hypothetical protein
MADPDPTPQPAQDPTPDPTPTPDPDPSRTFSQTDVDRIVQDRLARQKAQYAGFDELKAKADKFDELEQASKTDLEKANARVAQLEREAADQAQALQDSRLRSAVTAEAAKRNVVDPDAALALIDRAELTFGDDGAPTNIADAMESLLQARPYLVGGGRPASSADLGARGSGGDASRQLGRDDLKTMTPAQIVEADKSGQLAELKRGSLT